MASKPAGELHYFGQKILSSLFLDKKMFFGPERIWSKKFGQKYSWSKKKIG